MEVKRNQDGAKLELAFIGMLDTAAAQKLDSQVGDLAGITEIILDLAELEYIASSGMRALAVYQNTMDDCDGTLILRNVNEEIYETFDMIGLADILTIE